MIPPRIHLWNSGFLAPVCTVRCDRIGGKTFAHVGQSLLRAWDDPLEALTWIGSTFWPGEGRWAGYLSYDLGRLFERLSAKAADDLGLPLFIFTYCRPSAERPCVAEAAYPTSAAPLQSNFTAPQYQNAVRRALDYIRAGDIFQVNLSQRFSQGLVIPPLEIHRRLRQNTPAKFSAYLSYEDFAVVSNSPELFFRLTPDRRIVTRPVKGTRPLIEGMEEDLRTSPKDQAELNMIVDLERNDLGRVCAIGSVKVSEPRVIESHPTLYHGVATIEGQLRPDIGFVDLLRGIFPGGSVTGAPKIRAMEIIDELEPVRRGPYCGAIGYLTSDGAMEFSVAIRSLIAKDGMAYIPVGGGIVADSDPAREYEETLVKAQALFAALGVTG